MGVTVAVTRVALRTTTGSQTISTTDLGSLTPKAALFILTKASTDATAAVDNQWSFGAATGAAAEWAVGGYDQDNQSTVSVSYRQVFSDRCMCLFTDTGTVSVAADFTSFSSNGCSINVSTASGTGHLLTVVFFAGSDLSAQAGIDDLSTQDTEVDITSPGFTPDLIITGHSFRTVAAGGAAHGVNAVGACYYDGVSTVKQRCAQVLQRDNQATSETTGRASNAYSAIGTGLTGITSWGCDIPAANFDANGFSMYSRLGSGTAAAIGWLALNFGGAVRANVWTQQTPTSTGSDANTQAGFKPQFVMYVTTAMTAFATAYTDGSAGTFGVSVIDGDEQYHTSTQSEDAQGTTDTQSFSDNQALNLPDHGGTQLYAATFTSFDATGITLNYTTVDAGNQYILLGVAIELTTVSGTNALNAVLKLTTSVTAALAAILKLTTPVTAPLNAILKSVVSNTMAAAAVLKGTVSNTAAGQAVLKAADVAATAALNAALKLTTSSTAALNAVLKKTTSVTAALAAVLKDTVSNSPALNAVLKKTTSVTAALNARLVAAGVTTYSFTATLAAALKDTVSNTAAGRAVLKLTTSATAALNAYIVSRISNTFAGRAVLKATASAKAALNAYLADSSVTADMYAQARGLTMVARTRQTTMAAQPRGFTMVAENRND